MNNIEITRKEFHSILASFAIIPITVFVSGFYLGSEQYNEPMQGVVATPLEEVAVTETHDTGLLAPVALSAASVEVVAEPETLVVPSVDSLGSDQELSAELEAAHTTLNATDTQELQQALYAVQLGNFASASNADSYKATLHAKGVNAQVLDNLGSHNGQTSYRVILGLFHSEIDAKSTAQLYKQLFNEDAYVAAVY